ncbi:MAG: hypothetical protein KGR26_03280 [Cyanobacteria bacterium REEB65]|nr:hypothetical protein [Cyanobacteria bacterium REEB65]
MFRDRSTTVVLGLLVAAFLGMWAYSSAHQPANSANDADYSAAQHFDSGAIGGEAQKINLDEVHRAFYETAGSDFNSWMENFEKRVNEIYQGNDVVQVAADKNGNMIRVTGYIDRNGQPGYQPGADETLFQLQQTGPANGSQGFPYTMTGYNGSPYYQGYPPSMYYHHGLLDNPFVQLFVLSHLLTPSWHYYTPPARMTVLHHYVASYRQTPAFRTQTTRNKGFFSRMFSRGGTGLARSSKGFGSGNGSSWGAKNRSWYGGSQGGSPWSGKRNGSAFGSGSGWGSQRSFGGFGGGSGWGGRRSFGGFGGFSHSWGGRRH